MTFAPSRWAVKKATVSATRGPKSWAAGAIRNGGEAVPAARTR